MIAAKDQGSLLGAIAEYTERLAKDPHETIFVPLSEAYRQLGLNDYALEVARTGVQHLPEFGPGHVLMGRLLVERGETAGAATCFERALSIDAGCLPALKGLSRIRYQQGEHDAARQLLQQAAALRPDDLMVRKALANLQAQHAAASTGAAGEPAVKKGGAPIATPTIAEIFERQGLLQRALGVYRDLLQKDPSNQDLLQRCRSLQARIAADAGDIAPQVSALTPAPTADPLTTVAASPDLPPGLSTIQSLERLLSAVRRRREHVQ
jgi:tetratricopeptide (TPR) repeat protein